jgi:predicted nucleotidyltransferase
LSGYTALVQELAIPEELRCTLAVYKRLLAERFGSRLRSLRLFGSHARGDASPESDADVAVVVRDLSDAEQDWAIRAAYDAWRENGYSGPLPSPLVWSELQQLDRTRAERRIARDIAEEGIAL